MDYFSQKQYLAEVDLEDTIRGRVERWQAHKKNILHRGFTAALIYGDEVILQHRKHPIFDGCFDLSFSSHPTYIDKTLQSTEEAIYAALKREWGLKKRNLLRKPQFVGSFFYQAKDPGSDFSENEKNHFYMIELDRLPAPNYHYAYGYSLINKSHLKNRSLPIFKVLAPWVDLIINKFF